ncbi:hypothetical protein DMENIID0001_004550 [Sergentomyia squamirostris]
MDLLELNDDCLELIFSNFTRSQLQTAAKVCRRLRSVIEEFFWKKATATYCVIIRHKYESAMGDISLQARFITHLALKEIEFRGVHPSWDHFQNLKSLTICGCEFREADGAEVLRKLCENVKVLTMYDCIMPTDTLRGLLSAPNLELVVIDKRVLMHRLGLGGRMYICRRIVNLLEEQGVFHLKTKIP